MPETRTLAFESRCFQMYSTLRRVSEKYCMPFRTVKSHAFLRFLQCGRELHTRTFSHPAYGGPHISQIPVQYMDSTAILSLDETGCGRVFSIHFFSHRGSVAFEKIPKCGRISSIFMQDPMQHLPRTKATSKPGKPIKARQ